MPSFREIEKDLGVLTQGVLNNERSALGKAITLIESNHEEHQQQAAQLLTAILPHTGKSIRIAITGAPGAGKSSFINVFGDFLIKTLKKKVAVLAIDPSSSIHGGSILGDKTRMTELSVAEQAFIRPSPSGGDLGGVASRTRESILLCEAAGYDVVFVETVGVGQSETVASQMVDIFMVVLQPGAGDELQGLKKGIVELADIILVNKADGNLEVEAEETMRFYKQALSYNHRDSGWEIPVLKVSSLKKSGFEEVWQTVGAYEQFALSTGSWQRRREEQNVNWFEAHIKQVALRIVAQSDALQKRKIDVLDKIRSGAIHPMKAAEELIAEVLRINPS